MYIQKQDKNDSGSFVSTRLNDKKVCRVEKASDPIALTLQRSSVNEGPLSNNNGDVVESSYSYVNYSSVLQRSEEEDNVEAHGGSDDDVTDESSLEIADYYYKWIEANDVVAQLAFNKNTKSGPKSIPAAGFKDVTYTRDDMGSIYFDKPDAGYTSFTDPNDNSYTVDLKPAIGTLFSTTERYKHFSFADAAMVHKKKAASTSAMKAHRKGSWTWHHLRDQYKMVLVRSDVHRSYGHNGGVYIWS